MEEKKIKGFIDTQGTFCVQFCAQRLNDLTFLNNQEIARVMLAVRAYFWGAADKDTIMKKLNKTEKIVFINFMVDIDGYSKD